MVSKARLDLPLPLSPVMTMSRSRGRERSKPLRLCSRAPWMSMRSWGMPDLAYPVEAGDQPRGGTSHRPSRTGVAGGRRSGHTHPRARPAWLPSEGMSAAPSRSRSAELDALRAVAALAVLFFHADGLVYDSSARFDGVWAVRTELRSGVDLFFAISGLLI